jgi:lipopolysaccharide/colanic/teichoic acid biosynthesis glycosyltransferase
MAAISTGRNGFFLQKRVGQDGRIFNIIKLRTMRDVSGVDTTITAQNDMRITKTGAFLRKYKIDELPQLINVLKGDMSLVGPRPDVPGYADKLKGEDRIILSVKPGITGPASIKYKNEEALLAKQSDPKRYNDEVIYPDKVRINKEYIQNYTFGKDIKYLLQTIKG